MEAVCLDSDVIVDLIRGSAPLAELLTEVSSGVCTTSITVAELYYGLFKSGTFRDMDIVDKISKDLLVIDFSVFDAKLAGSIMAEMEKRGKKLDFRDVAIASICINRGFRLSTRNKKHFTRLIEFGLELYD
jgi:predicted nucleic acid-binding protein